MQLGPRFGSEAWRRKRQENSATRRSPAWTQLTIPVSSDAHDDKAHRANQAVVEVKAFAAAWHTIPGADLTEVSGTTAAFLRERGYAMTSPSLGHFCGMAWKSCAMRQIGRLFSKRA